MQRKFRFRSTYFFTDSFDDFYPDEIDADSVIEFPPNRTGPLRAKYTKLNAFSVQKSLASTLFF